MVQTGPHHILSNASDQTHLSLMGKTLELAPAASELPGCYMAVSCRAASPWVQAAHTLLRKCLPCPATEAPARSGPLRRLPPALSRCAEDRAVGGELGLQPPQAQRTPASCGSSPPWAAAGASAGLRAPQPGAHVCSSRQRLRPQTGTAARPARASRRLAGPVLALPRTERWGKDGRAFYPADAQGDVSRAQGT